VSSITFKEFTIEIPEARTHISGKKDGTKKVILNNYSSYSFFFTHSLPGTVVLSVFSYSLSKSTEQLVFNSIVFPSENHILELTRRQLPESLIFQVSTATSTQEFTLLLEKA
jgi:hypothetical protein